MEKLKLNNLKSGMLLKISEPYLVERYNEALKLLINKQTKLKEFQIDAVGYSPEIAEELNDEEYLNIAHVNQCFIILTIEQRGLPILRTAFTNKRYMFSDFITDNEEVIINITMRTSLYGEIEDNVLEIKNLKDILKLNEMVFECETPIKLISKSKKILQNINEIKEIEDSIFNDEIVKDTLDLIGEVGNPLKRNYVIGNSRYKMKNFFTSHLGGMYILKYNQGNHVLVIHTEDNVELNEKIKGIKVEYIKMSEQNILNYLEKNKHINLFDMDFYEKYPNSIQNKMNMILNDYSINKRGIVFNELVKNDKKKFIIDNYDELPIVYKELKDLSEKVKEGYVSKQYLNKLSINTKFKIMRPSDNLNQDNKSIFRHLITNYDNTDFIRMYAFNKKLFFKFYKGESELKKEYMIKIILENYVPERKTIKYYL